MHIHVRVHIELRHTHAIGNRKSQLLLLLLLLMRLLLRLLNGLNLLLLLLQTRSGSEGSRHRLSLLQLHLQLAILVFRRLSDLVWEGWVLQHAGDLCDLGLQLRDAVYEHPGHVQVGRLRCLFGIVLLICRRLYIFGGRILWIA